MIFYVMLDIFVLFHSTVKWISPKLGLLNIQIKMEHLLKQNITLIQRSLNAILGTFHIF